MHHLTQLGSLLTLKTSGCVLWPAWELGGVRQGKSGSPNRKGGCAQSQVLCGYLAWIFSFNALNSPEKLVWLFLFFSYGNWGSAGRGSCAKATQLVSGTGRTWTHLHAGSRWLSMCGIWTVSHCGKIVFKLLRLPMWLHNAWLCPRNPVPETQSPSPTASGKCLLMVMSAL
jgi:hypothetical protein